MTVGQREQSHTRLRVGGGRGRGAHKSLGAEAQVGGMPSVSLGARSMGRLGVNRGVLDFTDVAIIVILVVIV